jgi:hypothetical protein
VYQLSGLTFTKLTDFSAALPASISPVEPRSPSPGRPVEMYVDPAAGLVRFSVPLFNPTNSADPAAFFSSGNFPSVVDVQLWASYTPYVYRLCRDEANDDSPSAFFDYGDPNLASPVRTAAERASLGRFVVFWRRSHGASEAPHFGRTSFLYKTYSTAVQVSEPPLDARNVPVVTDVTDARVGAIGVIGMDAAAGAIGLPPAQAGLSLAGHRVSVAYDSRATGTRQVEYHTVPGWSEEKRVNVDSVYSEGPLVARKEWYRVKVTDAGGRDALQYLSRYWLFWTSPRTLYAYDPGTATGGFARSTDVYFATVVPESGTSVTEANLASR